MARLGVPQATTADTVLWLPFRDGELTDRGGQALTVTTAGTGMRPPWASGYYSDALEFGLDYKRLEVASAAAINFSGAFTLDAWVYSGDNVSLKSAITRRATAPGEKSAWALRFSTEQISFTVYSDAASSDTVTTPEIFIFGGLTARWFHVRCVFDPGVALYIFRDGALAGFKTTTLADVAATDLPSIQIGAEASLVATSPFTGRLAEIQIRDVADTSTASLPTNMGPSRISSEQRHAYEFDLREELQDLSWTTDGGGGFYIALADLDLGSFIVEPDDVLSVVETDGGVTTTYTEAGNVTDLDAATDDYFVDMVNRRLYSSEDPAAADLFVVQVRVRLADRGLQRGFGYYAPAVTSSDPGERRFPWWNEAYPLGAGARVELAAQSSALPANIANEEASGVIWTRAPARAKLLADGMPWSEAIALSGGFVDAPPTDTRDALSVAFLSTPAYLHRVPIEPTVLNSEDYPGLDPAADGVALPTYLGRGHLRVPTYVISGNITDNWTRKIAGHPIAAILALGMGIGPAGSAWAFSADLDAATFLSPFAPTAKLWADIAGLGDATDPTPTRVDPNEFGDPEDALVSVKDLLQRLLTLYLPSPVYGSSWTATDARIKIHLRRAEVMQSPDALLALVSRFLAESLTFLYWVPSTETWEWEDVVKADAIERILRDEDLISEEWVGDRRNLAKRANVEAKSSHIESSGELFPVGATTLALTGGDRYGVQAVFTPSGGNPTSLPTTSAADAWLDGIRPMLESPTYFHKVVVDARWAKVEQFAVIDNQTSRRPSGAGNRFRVLSVHPRADGTIALELASETLLPADGDVFGGTGGGETGIEGREPLTHARRLSYGDTAGTALAVTGTWTRVGDKQFNVRLFGGYSAQDVTHRFQVYAQRVGGAANADLQFRLRDVENGVTLASIAGVSTSAGFTAATTAFVALALTYASFESARIEIQYLLAVGASGTFWSASWNDEEGPDNQIDWTWERNAIWHTSSAAGYSLSASAAKVYFGDYGIVDMTHLTPGSIFIWQVTVAAGGSGTLTIGADSLVGGGVIMGAFAIPALGATATSVYEGTMPAAAQHYFRPWYTLTAGTRTVYAMSLEAKVYLL